MSPEIAALRNDVRPSGWPDAPKPHQPVLLLIAMAGVLRGWDRLRPFAVYEAEARRRLQSVGHGSNSKAPSLAQLDFDLPFCALPGSVWETTVTRDVPRQQGRDRVRRGALLGRSIHGGLTWRLHAQVTSDAEEFCRAVEVIVSDLGRMPPHVAIPLLTALGLPAWCEPEIRTQMDDRAVSASLAAVGDVLALRSDAS